MSIYEFADYLGISSRMVSKWEASPTMKPRLANQAALDTCLSRLDQAAQNRFFAQVTLAIKPQFEINFAVTCKTIEAAAAIALALSTRLAGHSHFEILDTTVGRRDLMNTRQYVYCGRVLPDTTRCPQRSGHPGLCGNPNDSAPADLDQPTTEQHPPPPPPTRADRPGQDIPRATLGDGTR